MPFCPVYYHLVWATQERMPLIATSIEPVVQQHLINQARALGGDVHAVNTVEDHVHLVVSVPPRMSLSDFVERLKEACAWRINQRRNGWGSFNWQSGYSFVSVGPTNLDRAIKYVRWQKEHHAEGTIVEPMERMQAAEMT